MSARRAPSGSFRHLDSDGSGAIERDDLVGRGAALANRLDASPTSQKAIVVTAGMASFWERLSETVGVGNGEGITLEKYRAGTLDAVADTTTFARVFTPLAQALMGAMDAPCGSSRNCCAWPARSRCPPGASHSTTSHSAAP